MPRRQVVARILLRPNARDGGGRVMRRIALFVVGVIVVAGRVVGAAPFAAGAEVGAGRELAMPVDAWHVVARESGPVNYYSVVRDPEGPFLRARYTPPTATAVLGF